MLPSLFKMAYGCDLVVSWNFVSVISCLTLTLRGLYTEAFHISEYDCMSVSHLHTLIFVGKALLPLKQSPVKRFIRI